MGVPSSVPLSSASPAFAGRRQCRRSAPPRPASGRPISTTSSPEASASIRGAARAPVTCADMRAPPDARGVSEERSVTLALTARSSSVRERAVQFRREALILQHEVIEAHLFPVAGDTALKARRSRQQGIERGDAKRKLLRFALQAKIEAAAESGGAARTGSPRRRRAAGRPALRSATGRRYLPRNCRRAARPSPCPQSSRWLRSARAADYRRLSGSPADHEPVPVSCRFGPMASRERRVGQRDALGVAFHAERGAAVGGRGQLRRLPARADVERVDATVQAFDARRRNRKRPWRGGARIESRIDLEGRDRHVARREGQRRPSRIAEPQRELGAFRNEVGGQPPLTARSTPSERSVADCTATAPSSRRVASSASRLSPASKAA